MKKLMLTITVVAVLFCQGCGMTGVYVVGGLIGAAIVLAPRDTRGSYVEPEKVAEEKAEKEALRNQTDSECESVLADEES